jgi:hypothetical protein
LISFQVISVCGNTTQGCTIYNSELGSAANEGVAEKKLLTAQFLGDKDPYNPFATA